MAEPGRNQERAAATDNTAIGRPLDAEEAEALVNEAEEAVIDMEAHERRRDTAYNTSGDDHDPGIDVEIDANAPKELRKPPKKRGST